jgi:hypothetical protein
MLQQKVAIQHLEYETTLWLQRVANLPQERRVLIVGEVSELCHIKIAASKPVPNSAFRTSAAAIDGATPAAAARSVARAT